MLYAYNSPKYNLGLENGGCRIIHSRADRILLLISLDMEMSLSFCGGLYLSIYARIAHCLFTASPMRFQCSFLSFNPNIR